MQTKTSPLKNNETQSGRFAKRIGLELYVVNIRFSEAGKETLEDKILRLVENESLKKASCYCKMESLRTERLPERGSA